MEYVKSAIALTVGVASVMLGSSAAAMSGNDIIDLTYDADTASGTFNAFLWDGGNGGGGGGGQLNFGGQSTLYDAMIYAATEVGSFVGAGFRHDAVNMYVIDFRGDSIFGDAGLTAFVMWGNGTAVGDFAGTVSASPIVPEGIDGTFTAGMSEVYELGTGVEVNSDGPLTIDIDVDDTITPIGYAITNLDVFPDMLLNQQFTLAESIRSLGIHAPDTGLFFDGVDDDTNGPQIFTDGVVIGVIPAPGAAVALVAGLGLLGRKRRRA